jgi:hypothetical protein
MKDIAGTILKDVGKGIVKTVVKEKPAPEAPAQEEKPVNSYYSDLKSKIEGCRK